MLLDTATGNGNAVTDSLGLTKDQLRTFLVDHHVSYTFARDEFVANPEAAIIRVSPYGQKLEALEQGREVKVQYWWALYSVKHIIRYEVAT